MTDDHDFSGVQAVARGLSDYDLDIEIAVSAARRNVAARHGYHKVAGLWQEQLLVLDDVRRERVRLTEAMSDAVFGGAGTDLGLIE